MYIKAWTYSLADMLKILLGYEKVDVFLNENKFKIHITK